MCQISMTTLTRSTAQISKPVEIAGKNNLLVLWIQMLKCCNVHRRLVLYPRGKDGLSEHVSIDLQWTSGLYASSYDHIHVQFVICMSTMSFPTNYTCRSKSTLYTSHCGLMAHMGSHAPQHRYFVSIHQS